MNSKCRQKSQQESAAGPDVTVKNQVMAGFPHLYYPSLEGFGERFVQACDRYRMKRRGSSKMKPRNRQFPWKLC